MFDIQARALLECEYRYYEVSAPYIFQSHYVQLGYKRFPASNTLSDAELNTLNRRIRGVLKDMASSVDHPRA